MKQDVEKRRQAWEAKKEIVRALQSQKEQERSEAKKQRIQERLKMVNAQTTIGSRFGRAEQKKSGDQGGTQPASKSQLKSSFRNTQGQNIRGTGGQMSATAPSGTGVAFEDQLHQSPIVAMKGQRKVQINIDGALADSELAVPAVSAGEFAFGVREGTDSNTDVKSIDSAVAKANEDAGSKTNSRQVLTSPAGAFSLSPSAKKAKRKVPEKKDRLGSFSQGVRQSTPKNAQKLPNPASLRKAKVVIQGLGLKYAMSASNQLSSASPAEKSNLLSVLNAAQAPAGGNMDTEKVLALLVQIEEQISADENSLFGRLYKFYQADAAGSKSSNSRAQSGSHKASPVTSKIKDLNLHQDADICNFFRGMCGAEGGQSMRHARLNRNSFKQFLQDRYSKLVGEKLILFLETQFNSLYRAEFSGFLQVITDLLHAGPECYKKMLFACLSLSNPGRICEHDIFTLMEQFKQRDSFFFYQELIQQ